MKKSDSIFLSLSTLLILSSLYLIIVNHSGVLFWDEWDTYAGWAIIAGAPLDQLFVKHNEHIAAFPKIINLIDYKLGATLLLGKFLSILLLFYFSVLFSRQSFDDTRNFKLLPFAIIFACELNWLNRENLIWANQFGFLLGIIGPLVGLKLFAFEGARRQGKDEIDLQSLLGTLFFLTSITSLISATIMLPITLTYLIWKKLFKHSLLVASFIVISLFIYGFEVSVPAHHPDRFSLTSTSITEFIDLGKYAFILVTRPLVEITFVPLIIKVALLSALLTLSFSKILKRSFHQIIQVIDPELTCILLYLFGVAGAIAVARFNFGVDTAFTSRYAVISLTLVSILSVRLIQVFPEIKIEVLLILMMSLAPIQLKYIHDDPDRVFNQRISTAGLFAGLYNSDYTSGIYYEKLPSECILETGSKKCLVSDFMKKIHEAKIQQVGFFKTLNSLAPFLKSASKNTPSVNLENLKLEAILSDGCTGFIDEITTERNVLVLKGWISSFYRPYPNSIFDENLGGIMVRGKWRPDVAEARGRENLHSGFQILVSIPNLLQKGAIFKASSDCYVTIQTNHE